MTMALKVLQVQSTACECMSRRRTPIELSDRRPITKNLASNTKNLPLRHAGSKVPEGALLVTFLDNELMSTGSDLRRRWAIMFPTSSTQDGKRQCCEMRCMNYQTEVVSFRGQLLLNISAARQWSWQYLTSMDQRS